MDQLPEQPNQTDSLTPEVASVSAPQRHRRKWLYICLVALLALVATAVVYILMTTEEGKAPATNNSVVKDQQSDPKLEANNKLTQLMDAVESRAQDEFADHEDIEIDLGEAPGPAYKTDADNDFYTIPSTGYLILINGHGDQSYGQTFQVIAQDELDEAGLVVSAMPDSSIGRSSTEYQSDQLVCSLSITSSVGLRCSSKLDYPSTDEMEPFVDSMKRNDDFMSASASYTIVSSLPTIRDSRTEGYQLAHGGTSGVDMWGGSSTVFYKKKSSSEWVYFGGMQQAPECSRFDTADLRAAFKGEPCMTEDGTSIVP